MIETQRPIESPLEGVKIETVPITHEDGRRGITEFQNDKELPFRNMKVIRIKSAPEGEHMRLGDHYHEDIELFFLESGKIDRIVLEDPDTGERVEKTDIGPNSRIELPPNVAHTLFFTQASVLMAFSENEFNPENLVPHKIKA